MPVIDQLAEEPAVLLLPLSPVIEVVIEKIESSLGKSILSVTGVFSFSQIFDEVADNPEGVGVCRIN